MAEAEPQALAATYSFGTSERPDEASVTVGFAGTRLDGTGGSGDRFDRSERIEGLGPGIGRVTVTTRIQHLNHGRRRVIAGPVETEPARHAPRTATVTATQFSPLAQGPGVRVLAWPTLVGLGAIFAVIAQALLVTRAGLPVAPVVGLFVGTITAYTFCRQFLFRLRSQSHTRTGRLVTQVLCAAGLVALFAAFVTT